jgi:phage terminase small subunit
MEQMKKEKLTPQWRKFADEYSLSFNVVDSYYAAGGKANTRAAAFVIGTRWLQKVVVQDYLKKSFERASDKAGVKKDEIVSELKKLAFSNIADFVEFDDLADAPPPADLKEALKYQVGDVRLKDWSKLTRDQLACVSELTTGRDGSIKFKLYDKQGALHDLLQHIGGFNQKIELPSGDDDSSKFIFVFPAFEGSIAVVPSPKQRKPNAKT